MGEPNLDTRAINTIRFLSVNAVEQANSGHPGLPMGVAAIAYVRWTRFLRHHLRNPRWPDRDRFVLSAGQPDAGASRERCDTGRRSYHTCPAAVLPNGGAAEGHVRPRCPLPALPDWGPASETPRIDATFGASRTGANSGTTLAFAYETP